MNNISAETHSTPVKPGKEQMSMEANHSSKGELIVKGVATAVAATVIIQSGKGVMSTLAKHPLVIFSLGITARLSHKKLTCLSIDSRVETESVKFSMAA